LSRGFTDLAAFDQLIAAVPVTPVEPADLIAAARSESLLDQMRYFIAKYSLLPQDALILATAEALGANGVVTLDRDWCRVTELDIYTTPC
jgi:predicted nucleic acid-binding protein